MSLLPFLCWYQWIWHHLPFAWTCLLSVFPSQLTLGLFLLFFSLILFFFFLFSFSFSFSLSFSFSFFSFSLISFSLRIIGIFFCFHFFLSVTQKFHHWINFWFNHQLLIGHGYLHELSKSLFQLCRSVIETRPLLLWPIRWPTLVFIELITRVSSPLSLLLIIFLAMLKSKISTCIKVWSWLVPHVVHSCVVSSGGMQ